MRSDAILAAAICALVALCQRDDRRVLAEAMTLAPAVERMQRPIDERMTQSRAAFIDASQRQLASLERAIDDLPAVPSPRSMLLAQARSVHRRLDALERASMDAFMISKDELSRELDDLAQRVRAARHAPEAS